MFLNWIPFIKRKINLIFKDRIQLKNFTHFMKAGFFLRHVSLINCKLVSIVSIGFDWFKTKYYIVIIISSFLSGTRLRRIPWELLLKLGLISVFGHWRLIAANCKVAFFISDWRRMFDWMLKVFLLVFGFSVLIV